MPTPLRLTFNHSPDQNGYRHNRVGGFYFADGDCLITETQILVSTPDWLRKLIAKQRAKPRSR
jgi:hypothetical protein